MQGQIVQPDGSNCCKLEKHIRVAQLGFREQGKDNPSWKDASRSLLWPFGLARTSGKGTYPIKRAMATSDLKLCQGQSIWVLPILYLFQVLLFAVEPEHPMSAVRLQSNSLLLMYSTEHFSRGLFPCQTIQGMSAHFRGPKFNIQAFDILARRSLGIINQWGSPCGGSLVGIITMELHLLNIKQH